MPNLEIGNTGTKMMENTEKNGTIKEQMFAV
jgi:hypothetical protein